jgi:hypothetical protein
VVAAQSKTGVDTRVRDGVLLLRTRRRGRVSDATIMGRNTEFLLKELDVAEFRKLPLDV